MKQIKTREFRYRITDKIKWDIEFSYMVWRARQMNLKGLIPGDETYPLWYGLDYFDIIRYYEDIDE